MHGATHFVTGIASGLAVSSLAGLSEPRDVAICAGLGGIAGLVPDWLQINVPGASNQLKGTFGHRGFSHWVWTALIATYVIYPIIGSIAYAGLAGWLSHIVLDALASGVPAFWPFGQLRLARVKTGGKTDKLTGGAMLVIAVTLIISNFF